jgi:YVTN family beta-propeller protein
VLAGNNGSSSVSVIDTADKNKVTTINVGSSPTSLAVSPDNSVVLVARSDDNVAMIDTKTNTVIGSLRLSGIKISSWTSRTFRPGSTLRNI